MTGQIIRFGAVGLGVNLAGYGVYLLLTWFGGEPKAVMTVLYLVGTVMSFFAHRKVTFVHFGRYWPAFFRFVLAYAFGYFLNLSGLIVGVDLLGYPHQIVQAIMVVLVALCLFVALRFWAFKAVPE